VDNAATPHPRPAAVFRPHRILVRGVNWLGDAVMATPALLRLREANPDASHHVADPHKTRRPVGATIRQSMWWRHLRRATRCGRWRGNCTPKIFKSLWHCQTLLAPPSSSGWRGSPGGSATPARCGAGS